MAKALNDRDVSTYHIDGYVLVKGLLDAKEVGAPRPRSTGGPRPGRALLWARGR